MSGSIIAQAASENSDLQTWLLAGAALLAPFAALGGVWLGSFLDRKSRREAHQDAERAALIGDAADVIGEARVAVTVLTPDGYAMWAREEFREELEKLRVESYPIRPRLAALAVRWPAAALELNAVEGFLGRMPSQLWLLVHRVRTHEEGWQDYLNQLKASHQAIINALDRAVQRLHEDERANG